MTWKAEERERVEDVLRPDVLCGALTRAFVDWFVVKSIHELQTSPSSIIKPWGEKICQA